MSEQVKKPIKITETILRDAHQSLIATRMPTDFMLPILEKMDKVGYHSVECWGGATFDASLRFLKEDPWDRLRKIRDGFKNTKLQMLFRGQNILGYRPYADDVVEYFVQKLFSLNSGDEYLSAKLTGRELWNQDIRKRISHSIVCDEETGDVIVKLVNLLPAEVKMDIDLSALGEQIGTAKRTILTGKDMNDRNARPAEDTIEVNGTRVQQTMPAYSLTILRF